MATPYSMFKRHEKPCQKHIRTREGSFLLQGTKNNAFHKKICTLELQRCFWTGLRTKMVVKIILQEKLQTDLN